MDTTFVITTLTTILLALFGYLVTYVNNIRIEQRKERLNRINKHLNELYGPLFALCHASDLAWNAFRSKIRPNQDFLFGEGKPLSEQELADWRLWMKNVFTPINERMYELVVAKADLLIEPEMPSCLLTLCAHVSSYKAVMKKWEQSDFTENTSVVNYPSEEILEYSQRSFEKLKAEQAELLGQSSKPKSKNLR